MNDTPESYRREWAAKSGRSEDDVYVPQHIRPWAEVAERPLSVEVATKAEQLELPLDLPPKREPKADYRTAYLVIVDHNGETLVSTDLEQAFTVEHSATNDDIRRSAHDVTDYAQSVYLAQRVADILRSSTRPRLQKHAQQRGLV